MNKFVGIYMDGDGRFFAGMESDKYTGLILYDMKGLDSVIEIMGSEKPDISEFKEAKRLLELRQ